MSAIKGHHHDEIEAGQRPSIKSKIKKITAGFVLVAVCILVAVILISGITDNLLDAYHNHGAIGLIAELIAYIVFVVMMYIFIRVVLWACDAVRDEDEDSIPQ